MKKRKAVMEQFLAIIYIQTQIYGFSHSLLTIIHSYSFCNNLLQSWMP